MTDEKNKQSSSDQGMKPSGGDKGSTTISQDQAKPGYRDDTDSEAIRRGGDIENPDQQDPGKRVELDDNPDETRRKIPNK